MNSLELIAHWFKEMFSRSLLEYIIVIIIQNIAYLSSNQEILYKSPKHVLYSTSGAPGSSGQYVAKLSSVAFDAVVAYMSKLSGRRPSKILPDSQDSR